MYFDNVHIHRHSQLLLGCRLIQFVVSLQEKEYKITNSKLLGSPPGPSESKESCLKCKPQWY